MQVESSDEMDKEIWSEEMADLLAMKMFQEMQLQAQQAEAMAMQQEQMGPQQGGPPGQGMPPAQGAPVSPGGPEETAGQGGITGQQQGQGVPFQGPLPARRGV